MVRIQLLFKTIHNIFVAPPDPVIPKVTVNCTDVSVYWSTPYYPPGCPLEYYQMKFNNDIIYFNMTNMSFHYSLPDLSHNTLYTISIGAVNNIGTSTGPNVTFITAIGEHMHLLIMTSFCMHVTIFRSNCLIDQ